jgi:hypothetical protein
MTRTAFVSKPAASGKPVPEPKPPKGPRRRLCKHCKTPFTPFRALEAWCSPDCGAEVAKARLALQRAKLQRQDRAETKAKLVELEPLEYFLKKAEKACNAYIRARDAGDGCISCGRHDAEQWNAGHFIGVGANRTLRFEEDNIHLQCARPCNKDRGGNTIEYRKALVKKIGVERVEWLEGWHPTVKRTREQIEAIEAYYKLKIKELKK